MSKQEEIKQALAAATPGPWKVFSSNVGRHEEITIGTEYVHMQLKRENVVVGHAFGVDGEYVYIRGADANLIAKAPEYIAYLLEESERLRSALETAQFHISREHYMSAEDAIVEALEVGQEGEGNQQTLEVTLSNEGYKEHQLKFDEE